MNKKRLTITATSDGIERAKKALIRLGIQSKNQFAEYRYLGRSTVTKFFQRQPIQCDSFKKICEELSLPWQEIADLTGLPDEKVLKSDLDKQDVSTDIDTLVQKVRKKIKQSILERCGTLRVLDMTQPIGVNDIYTDVNILETIIGRRRLEINELLQTCNPGNFDRFGLSPVTENRVPGIEAVKRYNKLMVLGKPGAGKTTFLKYLAIQCIEEQFQSNRVPIFITLKDFVEISRKSNVLKYIVHQLSACNVTNARLKAEQILIQGKALVLLDGLDEIREEDNSRVIKQIREFSEQYHENYIVVTCRIASKEYVFERFVEVEVADFDEQEIASFVNRWFQVRKPGKAEKFLQKLEEEKPIKELATNPLLLTLLCLIFEEKGKFKHNRSELYEEGIELLLEKWDNSRDIEREQIYKNMSNKRKEDLLSKIAMTTFKTGDYFFKTKNAEELISEYIYNLLDIQTSTEALRTNSKKILKSIESQHGLLVERAKNIYSFSHLTFQEYFTAKDIIANSNLKSLVEHVTEKRWREVFLLTVDMMRNADILVQLMKEEIDKLLVKNEHLQRFLTWVNQKSRCVEAPDKLAVVRAFYFGREIDRNLDLVRGLTKNRDFIYALDLIRERNLAQARDNTRNLILDTARELVLDLILDLGNTKDSTNSCRARDLVFTRACNLNLTRALAHTLTSSDNYRLKQDLQQIKDQLPQLKKDDFKQWWQENGQAWTEQLRAIMIEHRNIGHDWQFTNSQKELLKQYYDANKLLVDCLNSDCYVSREVRQEIEDTLLLPVKQ